MADQSKENENIPQKSLSGEPPENNHLFILDNQEKKLEAVSEAGKDGSLKTVPATKQRQKAFLEVGNNSDAMDIVVTALKNFLSQAKDPTRFQFFKMPSGLFKGPQDFFKSLNDIMRSPDNGDLAENYRFDPSTYNPSNTNKESINEKNQSQMAKQNQNNQDSVPENNTDRKYRFLPSMVNWDQLEKVGLSKELLEKKGFLDDMLMGRKSPDKIYLNMRTGGVNFQGEARLAFRQTNNGSVELNIHAVKPAPELDRAFRGHVFSPEDKQNLLKEGHLGRVVDLTNPNGQQVPSFISLDKITNEVEAVRASSVYIPNEINGIKLQKHEIEALKDGKGVFLEGMVSKAGKEFDATVRVDAVERRVAFIFNETGIRNKIGGVDLSEQQKQDLQEGKTIRIDGMVSNKTGEIRDSFVTKDPVTNKLNFTNFNPQSPEGAREIIIPRYINQVQLTDQDQKDLGKGNAVFLPNMIDRNGQSFDAFVKLNPETGQVMRSRTPDGFEEKPKLDIPKEIMGVKVSAKMRADIQDGKAVHIKGAVGFDNKPIPELYVKASASGNTLNFFNEDPDKRKGQSQAKTATISQSQDTKKKTGQSL